MDALLFYSMARPRGKVVEVHGDLELRRRPKNQLMVVPIYRRKVVQAVLSELLVRRDAGATRDDDGVAARVVSECGFKSAVVWPNLCDHIGKESFLGNSWLVCGRERRSFHFPGVDWRSSLDV